MRRGGGGGIGGSGWALTDSANRFFRAGRVGRGRRCEAGSWAREPGLPAVGGKRSARSVYWRTVRPACFWIVSGLVGAAGPVGGRRRAAFVFRRYWRRSLIAFSSCSMRWRASRYHFRSSGSSGLTCSASLATGGWRSGRRFGLEAPAASSLAMTNFRSASLAGSAEADVEPAGRGTWPGSRPRRARSCRAIFGSVRDRGGPGTGRRADRCIRRRAVVQSARRVEAMRASACL